MRNLGPKSAAWLAGIGITSRAELAQVGAIEADAIQGALMDCDWRALPPEFRRTLVLEFSSMKLKTLQS
ncbi:TfoX/Sxy family DNA transformation protein [Synechococcus sp. CCY 9618]|uniref:TfoX/Sxy family DNA transformation protein n=1 Tax=Synechococcus sp. CCY 9618 TaxID=2815602 RepID=UPI001C22B8AA|nr:TfoX/Sxy family DNA transformation protein [Synechococcus sp. CCY 9618]